MEADYSVCGHDVRTGRTTKKYLEPSSETQKRIQFSPDGRYLIVAGAIEGTSILDRTFRRGCPKCCERGAMGAWDTTHNAG